jgi:hypothetical protein
MKNLPRLLAAIALALSMTACGGVDSPSSQTPVDFSGTLSPGGRQSTPFSVGKTGEMQLTLQTLNPRPVLGFLELAVGVPSGSDCAEIFGYIVAQAAVGQTYSFPQITKGSYCLLIADSGLVLTQPAAFNVHLLHP